MVIDGYLLNPGMRHRAGGPGAGRRSLQVRSTRNGRFQSLQVRRTRALSPTVKAGHYVPSLQQSQRKQELRSCSDPFHVCCSDNESLQERSSCFRYDRHYGIVAPLTTHTYTTCPLNGSSSRNGSRSYAPAAIRSWCAAARTLSPTVKAGHVVSVSSAPSLQERRSRFAVAAGATHRIT